MLLIDDAFPLLVLIAPERYDAPTIQRMADAFDPYYERGERYALVSVQLEGSVSPGAHERKLLTDWVNSARVRKEAGRLCVGAAAVVPNAVLRRALTAMLWFWTPPFPLYMASNVDEALDHGLSRLAVAGVPLPGRAARVKQTVTKRIGAVTSAQGASAGA